MRKLPILLFTAVFALSLALPAYAAESSNEELKAASQYLNSHGIMVGDGEGNMNFSAPLTRAHLATILARLHGGSGQVEESRDFYAAQCKFQDVPDWARQYAGYCAYHGLMVGYGDGLFGAEDPVTPAAACTVILRYLALPDLVWDYNSACSTACDLGLSEPAMTAQGTISRGDLAVMLYRALTGNFQGTSAGAAGASVSISSYKGNILKAGTRSGLLVYPSDAQLELVSSNPEILTVEQIAGNWVAVAKSPGTASIFVVAADGEQVRLTITVSDVDEGRPAAGTDYADNLEIRTEILALVNQVRQEYGQSAAPADQSLMDAAQDYATRRNTWHDSQEECELVLAHGYPYGFSCNLTVFTSVTAEDVAKTAVKNWVNSPGHLRAMLDPKADSLGVGVVRYEGVTYCYLFVGMSGTINPYA